MAKFSLIPDYAAGVNTIVATEDFRIKIGTDESGNDIFKEVKAGDEGGSIEPTVRINSDLSELWVEPGSSILGNSRIDSDGVYIGPNVEVSNSSFHEGVALHDMKAEGASFTNENFHSVDIGENGNEKYEVTQIERRDSTYSYSVLDKETGEITLMPESDFEEFLDTNGFDKEPFEFLVKTREENVSLFEVSNKGLQEDVGISDITYSEAAALDMKQEHFPNPWLSEVEQAIDNILKTVFVSESYDGEDRDNAYMAFDRPHFMSSVADGFSVLEKFLSTELEDKTFLIANAFTDDEGKGIDLSGMSPDERVAVIDAATKEGAGLYQLFIDKIHDYYDSLSSGGDWKISSEQLEEGKSIARDIKEVIHLTVDSKVLGGATEKAAWEGISQKLTDKVSTKMEGALPEIKEKLASTGERSPLFVKRDDGSIVPNVDLKMRDNGRYTDKFGISPTGKLEWAPKDPSELEALTKDIEKFCDAVSDWARVYDDEHDLVDDDKRAMHVFSRYDVISLKSAVEKFSIDGEKAPYTSNERDAIAKYVQFKNEFVYGGFSKPSPSALSDAVDKAFKDPELRAEIEKEFEKRESESSDRGTTSDGGYRAPDNDSSSRDRTDSSSGGPSGLGGSTDNGTDSGSGGASSGGSGRSGSGSYGGQPGGSGNPGGPTSPASGSSAGGATGRGYSADDVRNADAMGGALLWATYRDTSAHPALGELNGYIQMRNDCVKGHFLTATYRNNPVYAFAQMKAIYISYKERIPVGVEGRMQVADFRDVLSAFNSFMHINLFDFAISIVLEKVADALFGGLSIREKDDKLSVDQKIEKLGGINSTRGNKGNDTEKQIEEKSPRKVLSEAIVRYSEAYDKYKDEARMGPVSKETRAEVDKAYKEYRSAVSDYVSRDGNFEKDKLETKGKEIANEIKIAIGKGVYDNETLKEITNNLTDDIKVKETGTGRSVSVDLGKYFTERVYVKDDLGRIVSIDTVDTKGNVLERDNFKDSFRVSHDTLDNGKVKERIEYDSDGRTVRSKTEFDRNERPVSKETYRDDGGKDIESYRRDGSVVKTSYDSDGKKTDSVTYQRDGKTVRSEEKYDKDGKVVERTTYYKDGSVQTHEKDNGDGTVTKETFSRGKMTQLEVSQKDGTPVSKEYVAKDGAVTKITYKDGKEFEKTIETKDGKLTIKETYNDDGSVTKEHYGKDGKCDWKEETRRDTDGGVVKDRFNGEGKLLSSEKTSADGSQTKVVYSKDSDKVDHVDVRDKNGNLLERTNMKEDGSSEKLSFEKHGDKFEMTKIETVNRNGVTVERQNFSFTESGQKYLSSVETYDPAKNRAEATIKDESGKNVMKVINTPSKSVSVTLGTDSSGKESVVKTEERFVDGRSMTSRETSYENGKPVSREMEYKDSASGETITVKENYKEDSSGKLFVGERITVTPDNHESKETYSEPNKLETKEYVENGDMIVEKYKTDESGNQVIDTKTVTSVDGVSSVYDANNNEISRDTPTPDGGSVREDFVTGDIVTIEPDGSTTTDKYETNEDGSKYKVSSEKADSDGSLKSVEHFDKDTGKVESRMEVQDDKTQVTTKFDISSDKDGVVKEIETVSPDKSTVVTDKYENGDRVSNTVENKVDGTSHTENYEVVDGKERVTSEVDHNADGSVDTTKYSYDVDGERHLDTVETTKDGVTTTDSYRVDENGNDYNNKTVTDYGDGKVDIERKDENGDTVSVTHMVDGSVDSIDYYKDGEIDTKESYEQGDDTKAYADVLVGYLDGTMSEDDVYAKLEDVSSDTPESADSTELFAKASSDVLSSYGEDEASSQDFGEKFSSVINAFCETAGAVFDDVISGIEKLGKVALGVVGGLIAAVGLSSAGGVEAQAANVTSPTAQEAVVSEAKVDDSAADALAAMGVKVETTAEGDGGVDSNDSSATGFGTGAESVEAFSEAGTGAGAGGIQEEAVNQKTDSGELKDVTVSEANAEVASSAVGVESASDLSSPVVAQVVDAVAAYAQAPAVGYDDFMAHEIEVNGETMTVRDALEASAISFDDVSSAISEYVSSDDFHIEDSSMHSIMDLTDSLTAEFNHSFADNVFLDLENGASVPFEAMADYYGENGTVAVEDWQDGSGVGTGDALDVDMGDIANSQLEITAYGESAVEAGAVVASAMDAGEPVTQDMLAFTDPTTGEEQALQLDFVQPDLDSQLDATAMLENRVEDPNAGNAVAQDDLAEQDFGQDFSPVDMGQQQFENDLFQSTWADDVDSE